MGVVAAGGTFLGTLEGAGWALAAPIVAVSSSVLLLWMLLLGLLLLRVRLPEQSPRLYCRVGENSFEYAS
jgi:hypothetical protein